MIKKPDIYELTLVLLIKDFDITILNPDFLRYNSIVPADWKLAQGPICTNLMSQVTYKVGVNIQATEGRIIFGENFIGRDWKDAVTPSIATKFVTTLPELEYTALGINPKGLAAADSEEETEQFAISRLVAEGPWKELSGSRPMVNLRFTYANELGWYQVSVDPIKITLGEYETPALSFGSNIHRDLTKLKSSVPKDAVLKFLNEWESELSQFLDFIGQTLLNK